MSNVMHCIVGLLAESLPKHSEFRRLHKTGESKTNKLIYIKWAVNSDTKGQTQQEKSLVAHCQVSQQV